MWNEQVTRDRLMEEYDKQWPAYGFAKHKGYGTPAHMEAIRKHGPCPIHRCTYAPLKHWIADGTFARPGA
jgi:ribonuclease HII